jgi:hypothetical protein
VVGQLTIGFKHERAHGIFDYGWGIFD